MEPYGGKALHRTTSARKLKKGSTDFDVGVRAKWTARASRIWRVGWRAEGAGEPLTVLQALKAGPETRAELAAALGRIPGQEAGSVLAGLLIDDQAEVRRAAAFSLGLRGDAAAAPALRPAVLDPDRENGAP